MRRRLAGLGFDLAALEATRRLALAKCNLMVRTLVAATAYGGLPVARPLDGGRRHWGSLMASAPPASPWAGPFQVRCATGFARTASAGSWAPFWVWRGHR
jgi:hypothetical protein